jgi:hypothetical protein
MSKSKAKPPPRRKTRPSLPVRYKETVPPVSQERKKRAEADTLPPPPDDAPPPPTPRLSGRVKKKAPSAATVDEVTADMSKDPRREE